MPLILPVILDGYTPRKDRSVGIRFITQEQTPDGIMNIHSHLDTYGVLYFKGEEKLTKEEIEELDNIDLDLHDKRKTQSQRIRNVLYRLYEQDPKGMEWKDFYKHHTELIIEWIKNKLD